jgi:DNA-binding MarR family transcriptional regulator
MTDAGPTRGLLSSLSAHCLRFLAEHPGASSTQVRNGLGMRHLSQASRLLGRLERDGLADGHRERGHANAWTLTARGQALLNQLQERWSLYA